MGSKIDLVGQIFGCWKVINPADSKVMNCGTIRTFWVIKCLYCLNEFEILTKTLRRKWVFPKCCGNCPEQVFVKRDFKYGRNKNGFIDKTMIIPL